MGVQNNVKKEEGIALVTVLSIMIILLIVSVGIVSLSTNNLKATGNVTARFQALKFAETVVALGMYHLNEKNALNLPIPYPPGGEPTPISGGTADEYDMLSFMEGPIKPDTCRLIVYEGNLFNPNQASNIDFLEYGPREVPQNCVLMIGIAEYGGYKRAIEAVVANMPGVVAGLAIDENININSSGNYILLNGIRDAATGEPMAGAIHANVNINYLDNSNYKCFNGSFFSAGGAIIDDVPGPGIDPLDKKAGMPPIQSSDWSVLDVAPAGITGATGPTGWITATLPDPSMNYSPPLPDPPAQYSLERPEGGSLPAPAISDWDRYVANSDVTIGQDTFVNGSLLINGDLYLQSVSGPPTLLVNGTFEVTGKIVTLATGVTNGGTIITTAYRPEPIPYAYTDPNSEGLSVHIGQTDVKVQKEINTGVVIFSTGDVILNAPAPSPPGAEDIWLANQPENVEATIEALKKTNLRDCPYANLDTRWNSIKSTLRNPDEVGAEVADWFSAAPDSYMTTSGPIFSGINGHDKWYTFALNPSLLSTSDDFFFQGIVYSYGDIIVKGNLKIVGSGVINENRGGTPPLTPPNSTASIYLNNGANIIADQEYMVGGKPVFRILTEILSWHEL